MRRGAAPTARTGRGDAAAGVETASRRGAAPTSKRNRRGAEDEARFHSDASAFRHFNGTQAATKDVCNFLHWHHRAQLVKASATRPWTTLAYETIYAAPERHDAALMSIVSPGRARIADGDPRACGEHDPGRAKPRNISRAADGFVLPTYLGLFDAPAVRRLARQIGSYVRRSENLTTPFLPPCFARNATTPRPGPREASRRRPVF